MSIIETKIISVFTDGSCHQSGVGGWAAIVLCDDKKIMLSGTATGTTHQRMELTAVLKTIQHLESQAQLPDRALLIFTDSQYIVDLPARKSKLIASEFMTKNRQPVSNADLVTDLLRYLDLLTLEFVKVSGHQKLSDKVNYNRDVDIMARKIVRDNVRNSGMKAT